MARKFTTDELVADIKRRTSTPDSQQLFSNQDIADFMDEELQTNIVPVIMRIREEYFVATFDFSLVAGQELYTIPERSIAAKLRDVVYILNGGDVVNIPRWSPEMLSSRSRRYLLPNNTIRSFFVRGNYIGFYPVPNGTGSVRFSYFRRPSRLTLEASCAQVESVDTNTGIVTTTSAYPTSWVAGTTIDAHSADFPTYIRFDSVDIEDTPSSTTFEIDTTNAALLSAGDWICEEHETPIPQIPFEGHNVLVQAAIVKVYEALGEEPELQTSQAKYIEARDLFMDTISNRVEGESKKIIGSQNIGDYVLSHRGNVHWW